MTSPRSMLTPRRIAEFCDLRLALVLEPTEVESLRRCLVIQRGRGGGRALVGLRGQGHFSRRTSIRRCWSWGP